MDEFRNNMSTYIYKQTESVIQVDYMDEFP